MTEPNIIVETHEEDLAPIFVRVEDVQSSLVAAAAKGRDDTKPDREVIPRIQEEVAKTLCRWLHVPETATFEVDVRRRKFEGGVHMVVSCTSDSNAVTAQLFAIGMLQQGDHPLQLGLA